MPKICGIALLLALKCVCRATIWIVTKFRQFSFGNAKDLVFLAYVQQSMVYQITQNSIWFFARIGYTMSSFKKSNWTLLPLCCGSRLEWTFWMVSREKCVKAKNWSKFSKTKAYVIGKDVTKIYTMVYHRICYTFKQSLF